MAISESQLETWSQQGKTGLFTDTYNVIRGKLLDASAPYPVDDVEVFLQGSYGNHTNVWADSDVDIVLRHNAAFYHDIDEMTPKEQEKFRREFPNDAAYGYPSFKEDAEAWIKQLYDGVQVGKKAVFVPGNNSRRNADILICQNYRRYYGQQNFHRGVAFYSGGKRVVNFPKQHSENCTAKHQATGNFKHMVRIYKNMRNSMIDKGFLAEGVAPSYFIEGMLSNVPDENFQGDYADAWVVCFNWIVTADALKLTTASRLHWLVRDNASVCWSSESFKAFTSALKDFWEG